MKTLVAYTSKYGTTRKCAEKIAEQLPAGADLIDLRRVKVRSFDEYDSVVIGGPIYAGKVMSAVPTFCERYRAELLERTIGLFVCCLYEGETALTELDEAYPPWLNAHAVIRRAVGGAIEFARLGVVDRYLASKVAQISGDIYTVKEEELSSIASTIEGYRRSSTRSPNTSGR